MSVAPEVRTRWRNEAEALIRRVSLDMPPMGWPAAAQAINVLATYVQCLTVEHADPTAVDRYWGVYPDAAGGRPGVWDGVRARIIPTERVELMRHAFARMRELEPGELALLACWFCSECCRYVGPGQACPCVGGLEVCFGAEEAPQAGLRSTNPVDIAGKVGR